MSDNEWRSKLDIARTHLAATIQEEIMARIEAHVLYTLLGLENDYVSVCRELLDGLDSAYGKLLIDPQAKPDTFDRVAFDALAAEARGEQSEDLGLKSARSERDAARRSMAGLNLEFPVRVWLEWRLKAPQSAG